MHISIYIGIFLLGVLNLYLKICYYIHTVFIYMFCINNINFYIPISFWKGFIIKFNFVPLHGMIHFRGGVPLKQDKSAGPIMNGP